MEIKQQILASEVIANIKNNPDNFWNYLQEEPPLEWTLEGTSELTNEKYRYIPIDILEFLAETVFGGYADKIINTTVQQIDKFIAITITVEVDYCVGKKSGIATVVVENNYRFIDGKLTLNKGANKPIPAAFLLKTATPLCLTEARKNALKNICNLFGRNLNRNIEEDVLPIINIADEKVEADFIIKKKYLNAVTSGDEKTKKEIESQYKNLL